MDINQQVIVEGAVWKGGHMVMAAVILQPVSGFQSESKQEFESESHTWEWKGQRMDGLAEMLTVENVRSGENETLF